MENIPPLPKLSGELMLEVFTHKSLRPDSSGEPTNDEYGGNDRLAELGAKVLEMAITFCLFSKRPMLKATDIEKQREELLSERNLENWISSYKLRERLRYAPSVVEDVKRPEESRFLLNCYIGAVHVENGLLPIQEWANRLINPDAPPLPRPSSDPNFYNAQTPGSPQPPLTAPPPLPNQNLPSMGVVALLNQTAVQRGIAISYDAASIGPPHQPTWTVTCMLNGIERGRGVGKSQKVAKEDAARQSFSALGWNIPH